MSECSRPGESFEKRPEGGQIVEAVFEDNLRGNDKFMGKGGETEEEGNWSKCRRNGPGGRRH